jgi:hypothetical protein
VTGFALGALCFLINFEEMLIIIFQQCPGSHMHEKESEIITRERASERAGERASGRCSEESERVERWAAMMKEHRGYYSLIGSAGFGLVSLTTFISLCQEQLSGCGLSIPALFLLPTRLACANHNHRFLPEYL